MPRSALAIVGCSGIGLAVWALWLLLEPQGSRPSAGGDAVLVPALSGFVPGLFLLWISARSDRGTGLVEKQHEILPAEGSRAAPHDKPSFTAPMGVLPLAAIFVLALAPALMLFYSPVYLLAGQPGLAAVGAVVGVNGALSLREAKRLIAAGYAASSS